MHMLSTPVRLVAALALLLAVACAPPDGDGGGAAGGGKADGQHGTAVASAYIQSNTPFFWAESDYESYNRVAGSMGWSPNPTPLADDEALAARLQLWADRIDAVVRADVELRTGAPLVAPRPIIKVLPARSSFNAWVSPTVACTGVELAGAPAPETPEGSPPVSFLKPSSITHASRYQCVRPSWPADSLAFVQFWDRPAPACSLSESLEPVENPSCSISGAPSGEAAIFATSPYVHVTTDLIAALDEKAVAFVIAHELVHYYRAHCSDVSVAKYDFWYETEPDRKKRPVPARNAADLKRIYSEIVDGPRPIQSSVSGRYSPRLRRFIVQGLIPLLAARTEPDFVCAAARDAAAGAWVTTLPTSYGTPDESLDLYLEFERQLVACAHDLPLGGEPGARELSYGSVLMAAMELAPRGVTLPWYATLEDVLEAFNAKAAHLDEMAAGLVRRLEENRVGLYTQEQEADNLALALATAVGITPDEVLAGWLEFMTAIEATIPSYYLEQYKKQEGGRDQAACKELLAAGFATTDASGAKVPVFVPIGSLDEPHHGSCYRLFNLWREQQLQHHVPAAAPDPAPGPDWAELKATAQRLSAEAPEPWSYW